MLRVCRTAAGVAVQPASLRTCGNPTVLQEKVSHGMEGTEPVGRGLGVMAMVQPRHSVHEVQRSWKDAETA